MGEITEFVELYIGNSDILKDTAIKVSNSLENNIKNVIAPGKVGYDTGHLHDNVLSNYTIENKNTAIVTGWYGPDYGKYWYRWEGGVDFLKSGLEKTIELYR